MAVIFPLDYAQAGTVIDDVRVFSLFSLTILLTLLTKELHDNLVLRIPYSFCAAANGTVM
jgi:hypothetical protein